MEVFHDPGRCPASWNLAPLPIAAPLRPTAWPPLPAVRLPKVALAMRLPASADPRIPPRRPKPMAGDPKKRWSGADDLHLDLRRWWWHCHHLVAVTTTATGATATTAAAVMSCRYHDAPGQNRHSACQRTPSGKPRLPMAVGLPNAAHGQTPSVGEKHPTLEAIGAQTLQHALYTASQAAAANWRRGC